MAQRFTPQSFLESLPDTNPTALSAHYDFLQDCANQGKLTILCSLFHQIYEQDLVGVAPWIPTSICKRIISLLALTAGYDCAVTALQLSKPDAAHTSNCFDLELSLASIVQRIVSVQSPQIIDRLLNELSGLETRALLLHEAVVWKKLNPQLPVAQQIAAQLADQGHPLSYLPLTLHELETTLTLPSYSLLGANCAYPFGRADHKQPPIAAEMHKELCITETTTVARAKQISAAFRNWEERSNGLIEARTFTVHDANQLTAFPTLLPRLGLACWGPEDTGLFEVDVSVRQIVDLTFAVACMGGVYSIGELGAYGRRAAWHSMAGLVGLASDAPIDEIADRAAHCDWYLFSSSSDWYWHIMDTGIACINYQKGEVAVLAASDTD